MSNQNNSFYQNAIKKFRKNTLGLSSLIIVLILLLISIFGYILSPDKTTNANWGDLSIKSQPPGFKVTMLKIPVKNAPEFSIKELFVGQEIRYHLYPISDYKYDNDKITVTLYNSDKSIKIEKDFFLQEFADYNSINEVIQNNIYTQKFYLGTDKSGRDYLSRMIIGSRISLSIGFVAVIVSLVVGVFFGMFAGYFGGKIDAIIMWLINIVWSIPTLLLVIAITLALGKGFWQVFVAVGLTMWVEVARVVRGQVLSIKQLQYITAAKALGYSNIRIMLNHILPNLFAPIIVISAANFASAILVESGLSFLGLGAQPPVPSWGGMIKESYGDIILGKPYLAIFPGIAISLVTLCFMMIGNSLRDALDVKN